MYRISLWKFFYCINICTWLLASADAQTNQFKTEGTAAFELYRILHQDPELGKKEFHTSSLLKKRLIEAGITEFHSVPGLPTAVIAVLDTHKPGPVIALRAEMDARPDTEATGLAYASKIPGIMHSCGHDAHAAILCTAATYLKKHSDAVSGKILFVFQPAEEVKGGADDIVNSGILTQLGVEAMFALRSQRPDCWHDKHLTGFCNGREQLLHCKINRPRRSRRGSSGNVRPAGFNC